MASVLAEHDPESGPLVIALKPSLPPWARDEDARVAGETAFELLRRLVGVFSRGHAYRSLRSSSTAVMRHSARSYRTPDAADPSEAGGWLARAASLANEIQSQCRGSVISPVSVTRDTDAHGSSRAIGGR